MDQGDCMTVQRGYMTVQGGYMAVQGCYINGVGARDALSIKYASKNMLVSRKMEKANIW